MSEMFSDKVQWEINLNESKQYLVFHSLSLGLCTTPEKGTEKFLTETNLVSMQLNTDRNTPTTTTSLLYRHITSSIFLSG